MKKGYQAIVYIVIILILLAGLALFLWRDNILDYINTNTGVASLESTIKTQATSNDTLDTGILSDARFTALKNNVVKFDFDSICKVPAGGKTVVASTTDSTATSTATSTVVQSTGCLLGNSIPFPVTVKKAN